MMKNITIFIIISVLLLLINSSCKQDNTVQIKKLDSLNYTINSIEKILKTISIKELQERHLRYKQIIKKVKNISTDSVDTAFYNQMSIGKVAKKTFKTIISNHNAYIKALEICKQQHADLKKDVNNNTLHPDSFKLYYKKENDIANELYQKTIKNLDTLKIKNYITQYDSVEILINNYLDNFSK